MPKPYPRGFRDDVVRVARDRDPGVTVEQIAKAETGTGRGTTTSPGKETTPAKLKSIMLPPTQQTLSGPLSGIAFSNNVG